jgi:hypothetical protein
LGTLEKLIRLPGDGLVGDDSCLFFTVIANLPRFLHATDQEFLDNGVVQMAETLMAAADDQGLTSVAVVLDNYLASKYASEDDFVAQMFAALRERFLPELDFRMVTMLMGFLTNGTSWVKIKTMRILRVVIPEVDMKKPEISSHGSDMISPLLRLLQTEYCMEALEVLDNIMTMSGSSMDKHHLRMSMTRPTSKAVRKEYERTQSLFGIPEASGWAIPMPARKTDSTRANIHAAFYMCQSDEGVVVQAPMTPEVEFHTDDFPYGYFPGSCDRADTMMSDDGRVDVPMGDLFSKLDSLDDFFDDLSTSPPSDGRSSRTVTEFSPDTFDSGAQLYDEQILPILHQASNNSTMSFQNGFTDRPIFMPREGGGGGSGGGSAANNTMNPGAFNVGVSGGTPSSNNNHNHNSDNIITTTITPPSRPGLHARSITSPSAPASYHSAAGDVTSDDELFSEDVFSDGDDERPSTANGESAGGSFFLENVIRPLTQSTRSRVRRMTGGRSRDGGFPLLNPGYQPQGQGQGQGQHQGPQQQQQHHQHQHHQSQQHQNQQGQHHHHHQQQHSQQGQYQHQQHTPQHSQQHTPQHSQQHSHSRQGQHQHQQQHHHQPPPLSGGGSVSPQQGMPNMQLQGGFLPLGHQQQ